MRKSDSALSRLNTAFSSINLYRREVSDLVPKHANAVSKVKNHVSTVEDERQQYIEV